MNRHFLILLLYTFLLFVPNQSWAKQVALVIGVTDYPPNLPPENRLPGAEKDAARVNALLKKQGFQVRLLINEQATPTNIRKGMRWLETFGNNPKNSILFYYTGHGFRVKDTSGDEADGYDETLFAYATNPGNPRHHILDDELRDFAKNITKAKLLFFIDSCHSGTMTKQLRFLKSLKVKKKTEWTAKDWSNFFRSKKPGLKTKWLTVSAKHKIPDIKSKSIQMSWEFAQGHVLLAASKPNEKANDIGTGSLHTFGLLGAIKKYGPKATNKEIHNYIRWYVQRYTKKYEIEQCKKRPMCLARLSEFIREIEREKPLIQHPQIEGSSQLQNASFFHNDSQGNECEFKGFRETAGRRIRRVLRKLGICRDRASKPTIEVSHDGSHFVFKYRTRLFLRFPANKGNSKSELRALYKNLKRVARALKLLKQWSRVSASGAMSVRLLRKVNSNWKSIQGKDVKIGTRIGFRLKASKTCYPTVMHLSNKGAIEVLYPRVQGTTPSLKANQELAIPPGAAFRLGPPKGVGMVIAFCSTGSDRLATIRQQIRQGDVNAPKKAPSNTFYKAFYYYIVD